MGCYFFFQGDSIWEHPLDQKFRRLYWEVNDSIGGSQNVAPFTQFDRQSGDAHKAHEENSAWASTAAVRNSNPSVRTVAVASLEAERRASTASNMARFIFTSIIIIRGHNFLIFCVGSAHPQPHQLDRDRLFFRRWPNRHGFLPRAGVTSRL